MPTAPRVPPRGPGPTPTRRDAGAVPSPPAHGARAASAARVAGPARMPETIVEPAAGTARSCACSVKGAGRAVPPVHGTTAPSATDRMRAGWTPGSAPQWWETGSAAGPGNPGARPYGGDGLLLEGAGGRRAPGACGHRRVPRRAASRPSAGRCRRRAPRPAAAVRRGPYAGGRLLRVRALSAVPGPAVVAEAPRDQVPRPPRGGRRRSWRGRADAGGRTGRATERPFRFAEPAASGAGVRGAPSWGAGPRHCPVPGVQGADRVHLSERPHHEPDQSGSSGQTSSTAMDLPLSGEPLTRLAAAP